MGNSFKIVRKDGISRLYTSEKGSITALTATMDHSRVHIWKDETATNLLRLYDQFKESPDTFILEYGNDLYDFITVMDSAQKITVPDLKSLSRRSYPSLEEALNYATTKK